MMTDVLKMFFIGTAFIVLAALMGMVDSFGGLMYVQDADPADYLQLESSADIRMSSTHSRGSGSIKRIGS
jgi:hypothetical protein